MTAPKWVIPMIAVIAAVAVAVAAALLAARFAPPPAPVADPTPAPPTQVVPVLEPIAVGDEPPAPAPTADEAAAAEGDEGAGLLVSEAVAEREVAVPSTPEEEEAEFIHLVDFLTASPDGILALLGAGTPRLLGDDDVCASDDPPADCPPGLTGAIFPTIGLRDLIVGGEAYPPTSEEYGSSTRPYTGPLWCDGLEAGEGEVPFGILSSAPGRYSVIYWPTGQTGAGQRVTVESSAEQIEEWNAAIESGDEWATVRHCLTLPGILPDTVYTATVIGNDIHDRTARWHTSRFHSDGAPVHAGLQVSAVGDNLIFASALAQDDETVEIRAARIDPGEPATCEAADAGGYEPLTEVEVRVDDDAVAAVNALPGSRNKTVVTFSIPEGTTAVVCARWFPGEAPAWERAQHVFESVAVVSAPDRLVPRVRLYEVNAYDDRVADIVVWTSTAEGTECGATNWQPDDPGPFPREICRPGFVASGEVDVDEAAGRISTRSFSGDLVIEAETRLGTGESSSTSYLIPAGDGACRGVCETPWSSWYRVALADIEQGIGLCGSSFGASCTPPTTTVTTGALMVRVSWEQGDTNGYADWRIGPSDDRAVEYVVPDTAQLDDSGLRGGWTFSDPTVAAPWSTGTLLLNVDRAVSYRLTVTPTSGIPGEPGTGCSGARLEATGSTTRPGSAHQLRADIAGLCPSATYFAQLELTDTSGRTTVYGFDRATTTLWTGGFLTTPRLLVDIAYDAYARGTARSYLDTYDVRVNYGNLQVIRPGVNRCDEDGNHSLDDRTDGLAVQGEMVVIVEYRVTGTVRWGTAEPWGVDCFGDPDDDTPTRTATFDISLDDLMNPYGIVLTSPELPGFELRLHGLNPRVVRD